MRTGETAGYLGLEDGQPQLEIRDAQVLEEGEQQDDGHRQQLEPVQRPGAWNTVGQHDRCFHLIRLECEYWTGTV